MTSKSAIDKDAAIIFFGAKLGEFLADGIIKQLTGGTKTEEHEGRVLFTDNRLLFESTSKTIKIRYKSIVAWKATSDRIQLLRLLEDTQP